MFETSAQLIERLKNIKKGQRITYFKGENLSDCNEHVRSCVRILLSDKRVRPHLKRLTKPTTPAGSQSKHAGVGTFDYFVIGL